MASKTTITKEEDFHLYEEPYDEERLYLELKNPEFHTIDNYYGDSHERKLTVTISKDVWYQLVKGFLEAQE